MRVIDESFDHIWAERLTPNLVWMTQPLPRNDELQASDPLLKKLGPVSLSTESALQVAGVRLDSRGALTLWVCEHPRNRRSRLETGPERRGDGRTAH